MSRAEYEVDINYNQVVEVKQWLNQSGWPWRIDLTGSHVIWYATVVLFSPQHAAAVRLKYGVE